MFTAPTLIEKSVVALYGVQIIGRTDEIKEHYYGISRPRKIKHPAILEIINTAHRSPHLSGLIYSC
jgi:LysR family transcriptional activator of nhaA